MEKLKVRNRKLAKENAMLKTKLIEMGKFSERMVEITAEMDDLLVERSNEIIKLKEEIKSSVAVEEIKDVLDFIEVNVNAVCKESAENKTPLLKHGTAHQKSPKLEARIQAIPDTNHDGNDLEDFTIELDNFVNELTQIKEEPMDETYKAEVDANTDNFQKTQDGMFRCPYTDVCSYKTKRRTPLVIHIRRHTGEKPFKCQYCEMRFCTRGHCQRHQLTHPQSNGVNCEFCHVRFKHNKIEDHEAKCSRRKERRLKRNR